MKTIFKSLLLIAIICGIANTASAQGSPGLGANKDVNVAARILKQITLDTDSVSFGAVSAGIAIPYLNPIHADSNTNVGFNARLGRLTIDASANEPVRVDFPTLVTMRYVIDIATNQVYEGTVEDSLIYYKPELSIKGGDLTWSISNVANSTLISKDTPASGDIVAATNNDGFGPFGLVQTQTPSEKVTLWIGGKLYATNAANDLITSVNTKTGRYLGTMNFNVTYFN